MSASKASKSFQDQTKNLQTFFETALRSIQLGDDQLKNQNYEELLDSLETINDAIRNPYSFGTVVYTVQSLCQKLRPLVFSSLLLPIGEASKR